MILLLYILSLLNHLQVPFLMYLIHHNFLIYPIRHNYYQKYMSIQIFHLSLLPKQMLNYLSANFVPDTQTHKLSALTQIQQTFSFPLKAEISVQTEVLLQHVPKRQTQLIQEVVFCISQQSKSLHVVSIDVNAHLTPTSLILLKKQLEFSVSLVNHKYHYQQIELEELNYINQICISITNRLIGYSLAICCCIFYKMFQHILFLDYQKVHKRV
ncbi:unnamed protein product [Paramecium primaurelia]|uniref:Transmembrane protein n=1 Tax=Paramecium primaurelia TaxID=5886 RepID=A0A8S1JSH2_PARPR|nr:unnamed protein product [Paramecium primaurelia]